jgi:hypothetical protein
MIPAKYCRACQQTDDEAREFCIMCDRWIGEYSSFLARRAFVCDARAQRYGPDTCIKCGAPRGTIEARICIWCQDGYFQCVRCGRVI